MKEIFALQHFFLTMKRNVVFFLKFFVTFFNYNNI